MGLVPECELAALFPDCEVGAMPPFGPLYGMPVLAATCLTDNEDVAFSCGSHRHAVRLRWRDLEALTHPVIAALCRRR